MKTKSRAYQGAASRLGQAGEQRLAESTSRGYPSIRTALMMAVGLAIIPALGLIVFSGLEHSAELATTAREETKRQAEAFAEIQRRVVDSTRQVLLTLTALPEFRNGQYEAMGTILKAVHSQNKEYLNFTSVDAKGTVVASSLLTLGTELGDRYHFREALDHGRFVAGKYMINMIDSTPAMAFSYPITDYSGRISGALAAIIKLDMYDHLFESMRMRKDSILALVDADGKRLYYYPPKETNPLGEAIQPSMMDTIVSGGESGSLTVTGVDGIMRFYAYRKLRLEPSLDPYVYVFYASPLDSTLRMSRIILVRNLVLMATVFIFALLSAGLLSRKLFGNRLDRIVATTQLIERGDLGARVGLVDTSPDLGSIARSLDSMAENLQRRDQEKAAAAAEIMAGLAEKEILLKEIHHRVKNNLQLVMSLFVLQRDESDDPEVFTAAMENRIRSMAMVHEMLYESGDLQRVDLGAYADRLAGLVSGSFSDAVSVRVTADAIQCDLDKAISFGLMLNELLTNAYKHAFKDRADGTIEVTLHSLDGTITVEVRDDGPGLPKDFSITENSSLGLRLAQVLTAQLNGKISWNEGSGAVFTIHFPLT